MIEITGRGGKVSGGDSESEVEETLIPCASPDCELDFGVDRVPRDFEFDRGDNKEVLGVELVDLVDVYSAFGGGIDFVYNRCALW